MALRRPLPPAPRRKARSPRLTAGRRNFVIDTHPDLENVWLAGAGTAESIEFGPVVDEYVAQRVLGEETDPEIDAGFWIPEEDYKERGPAPESGAARGFSGLDPRNAAGHSQWL